LEQLAADLLSREGYDVQPTSTSGPDNGRDAFVEKADEEEQGIVHCSVQKDDIEDKIKDDAGTAADHKQDYDFFIFFTTQDRATVMRDRLEKEISDEYGFRTRIWDFEHIRNSLMGDTENHDLARHHLSVDPAGVLDEVKSQLDRLENKEDLKRLRNRPRLSIDSWEVTEFDEPVPLMAPESIEKTQTQLSFSISNVGEGNAYNLQSCLYAKPIDDLSSPPIDEVREELLSAEATSKLRRGGREPERDPKNHLESSDSANFLSNTFVHMHGRKGHAFGASATGPFPPETTPPDGFAVGVKLMYDDEFEETREKVIFAAIGGVPQKSLQDFFMRMKGIVRFDEFDTIFPEEIQFG
jgi:hypothetical protein